MDHKVIAEIAKQELVINIRNRWTLIFAIIFGALVVSISYFGMKAEGFSGMQNFTRTSASLLNLVLYVVPLVALVMGTLSFTGDKGSTELLYSQPVLRSEVMFGKLLGVFSSISASTLAGFALAGIIVVALNGFEGLSRYLVFVILSLTLSLAFLSIAMLVATFAKRKPRAFGYSLFIWFFFVIFYDLMAIGATLLLKGKSASVLLFVSLFGNPVDMVRVATLIALDNVTIFGAAGASLLRFFGGSSLSTVFLVTGLTLWIVLPFWIALRLIRHQDI